MWLRDGAGGVGGQRIGELGMSERGTELVDRIERAQRKHGESFNKCMMSF